MNKLKIAIISNDDKVWSLYAWNNVLNSHVLDKDYTCVGFWTCNQKFSNKKKLNVWGWYLSTFRFWNFFKLISFVISYKFFSFLKSITGKYHLTFSKLSKAHNIPLFKTPHPNSPEFINWVKENEIDILVIMVDHILKKEILNTPKICVLNKHAAVLPANKGLFPYLQAKLSNEPQGISFHKVNEAIDEGDLYYQEKVEDPELTRSMVAFYFYVYKNYYKMLDISLKNIVNNITILPDEKLTASYYSLPTLKDYVQFKKKGGSIIKWSDMILPLDLLK